MKTSIHPFPARMAPDLALKSLERLNCGVVLDPMTGSGTVARMAKAQGLSALAFDLDPLAVLISKVGTTPVEDDLIEVSSARFLNTVKSLDGQKLYLNWIDDYPDTVQFVDYWFGKKQQEDLRKFAYVLSSDAICELPSDVADVLRIALSRIIVTKKQAASLAQDTSHSRPHRVSLESDYDIFAGFEKSLGVVRKRLAGIPNQGNVTVRRGDARDLSSLPDESADLVLTSPPYLNAIDYMRGHRMSLIWLGHRLQDLSKTRSNSIGSERGPDRPFDGKDLKAIKAAMGDLEPLKNRFHGIVERYVIDTYQMISEVARILKPKCTATFVMGNSCLQGVYIQNSEAVAKAGELLGLGIASKHERELPSGNRYLPTPDSGALSKRMRKEVILTFTKETC